MPWQPNGDYYVFDEHSIKTKAPPVSGVYGLYNIKRQLLIGESANIRETLLQHVKKPGLRRGSCRPTGFTFEVCPATLLAQRTRELTAEYRPVLQTRGLSAFAHGWNAWKNSGATAFHSYHEVSTSRTNKHKSRSKLCYFSRDQVLTVALAFTTSAAIIGSLGIYTGKNIEQRKLIKNEKSTTTMTFARPLEEQISRWTAPTEEGDSLDGEERETSSMGDEFSQESTRREETGGSEITLADPAVPETATATARTDSQEHDNGTATLPPAGKERQAPQAVSPEETVTVWTVQVKSSVEKEHANHWVDRLNSKGYKAFLVEADLEGRTWYRVRVGPFNDRDEAETLRQILQVKEGINDAFLTKNELATILLLSQTTNPRDRAHP
ncbi:MAG: SPOR domain-containing protein [Candidatus Binatia bacterium]